MPLPRDGWLSPIELDERAEPLTTAMAVPQTPAAATKRTGSSRSRRASDRGLLPMTLESYLRLLDWTGRQLRAGTKGVIPPGLASILDRLQVRPSRGWRRWPGSAAGSTARWAWPTICKPRPSVWAWPGCTACAGARRHSHLRPAADRLEPPVLIVAILLSAAQ